MLFIPYDRNRDGTRDGKKIETFKVYDTFLGFDLKDGKNNIVITYNPRELKAGSLIALATILLYISYLGLTSLKNKHIIKS